MDLKLRQRLFRGPFGLSPMGDGLVRLRSASIALMAAVAGIGLVLVALISQMGWPTVHSGPIPAGPGFGVVRNDPIVAPPVPVRSPPGARREDLRIAAGQRHAVRRNAPGSRLGSSHQVHQAQPDPAGSAPPPQSPPSTPPQPAAPTEPVAVVVTTPSRDAGQPPGKQRAAEEKPSKSRGGKARSEGRRGRRSKTAAAPPATGGGEVDGSATQHGPSGEVGAEDAKDGADPGKGSERGRRGRGGD